MKQLMLGNKAVARGFYEAGCCIVSSYPGTPSTEITEEAVKYDEIYCEWAPNEKVALEAAHGASLGGRRAACCMKHVGLNVAADPLFSISYIGTDTGLVILVADDPGMHSSQNEQDSRHYAIAAKVPMLEPADSQEACDYTKEAFALSEQFHTPVIVRMVMRICHSQSVVDTCERVVPPQREYIKDQSRVMLPAQARKAHVRVEQRTKDLVEFAETSPLNRVDEGHDHSMGFITSSTCYQYVKELFGDTYPVLKIGMCNPLPVRKFQDFAAAVDRVIVVEELDPILENHCRMLGIPVEGKSLFPMVGEFSQSLIASCLGMEPKTTQAIAANPSDAEAYKQRAVTLCQMQQYEEAEKDLNTLIDALHTEDAEIYQLRGTLRMQRGDKTGALDDMRKAIDLNPDLLAHLSGEFKTKEKGHC